MRTRGDEAEEFVKFGGLNHVEFMAVLAFHFDDSFHEESFKE